MRVIAPGFTGGSISLRSAAATLGTMSDDVRPTPEAVAPPGSHPGSRHRALLRFSPLILAAGVLLVGAAILASRGDREAAMLSVQIAMVVPAPLAVERAAKLRLPTSLHAMYAALLLAAPWAGAALGRYDAWPSWDTLVHFYSGVPIALGCVLLLGVAASRRGLVVPPGLEALMVAALHSVVALLWEVAEFTADQVFGAHTQKGNMDTMVDLIVGTLGAVLVALALYAHRTRGPFAWMSRFTGGGAALRPGPSSLDGGAAG